MSVFKDYAYYYDLLYQDKDYQAEADYITELIKKNKPDAKTVLELGCGTGKHAVLLAEKDFNIYGVDISQDMVVQAQERLKERQDLASKLAFCEGDVRNVKLDKKFDVIISLFHVISYQITNQDLQAMFQVAKEHLNEGGIFIFDCWYGPAVLSFKPDVRVKRFEDGKSLIIRIAEPKIYPNDNLVDVNYQMLVIDKLSEAVKEFKETHKMRYLFKPELELFFEKNNFKLIDTQEWLSAKVPGFDTWGVCFICKKV